MERDPCERLDLASFSSSLKCPQDKGERVTGHTVQLPQSWSSSKTLILHTQGAV